jgi:threonine/homoserine/homoserine lactone efflux protein
LIDANFLDKKAKTTSNFYFGVFSYSNLNPKLVLKFSSVLSSIVNSKQSAP